MKLLLTSGGFTNKSIIKALRYLTGKPFKEQSLAFIPTAANVEDGDKSWLIDDMNNARKLGFSSIDVVDISAISREMGEERLRAADIIMVGGGNTFHLMYWINKSGLSGIMKELLETKVYVGISAGSMVMAKSLELSQASKLYYEDVGPSELDRGLGYVDFQVRPHLNSEWFKKVRDEYLKELAKEIKDRIYAIDDATAIQVVDGKVSLITEGTWIQYN